LNCSSFYGDNSGHYSGKTRFAGGAFFTFSANKYLAFQAEVFFSQKGAGIMNFDYLEFPLLIKSTFPIPTKKIRTNLFFGYAPAILASEYIYENGRRETHEWFGDHYDNGLVFGVGLDINVWKISILPEFRYSFGLNRVVGGSDDPVEKNQVFSFLIGFALVPHSNPN
jgi:hypothetical protein